MNKSNIFILAMCTVMLAGVQVRGQSARLKYGAFPSKGALFITGNYGVRFHRSLSLISQDVKNILQVACKMAGLHGTPSLLYTGKYSKKKTWGRILEVQKCNGDESSLLKCPKKEEKHTSSRLLVININCGYPSAVVGLLKVNNQSSVASGSSEQNAVNEDPNKCFVSQKEKNPWIELSLTKSLFIHTLTLIMDSSSAQLPDVMVYDKLTSRDITCTVTKATGKEHTAKCKTWYKTNTIKIALKGENVNLTLCRLDVFGIESTYQAQGTFLQAWKNDPISSKGSILKFDARFKQVPDALQFLSLFDIKNEDPTSIYEKTIKQTAYVMVTQQGTYSFGVACNKECEVWFRRVEESGLDDPGTPDELIIKFGASPSDDKYEESSKQNEKVLLSICHFYGVEVYTQIGGRLDEGYTNLAVKRPGSAAYSVESLKELLYWTRPGSRELHFTITNRISKQINLGSSITLQAAYKFCCQGLKCPSCPTTIQLHVFDKTYPVNNTLQMDCKEYNWAREIDVVVQPKNYSIQISYSFVGDISGWQERRTIVNTLEVTVSIIYSCTFAIQRCKGWKVLRVPSTNKLTKFKRSIMKRNADQETYNASQYSGNSTLKSPLLPWTSAYTQIQLCVLFSYLLPTRTQSSLDVYISTSKEEKLVWSIKGYQGVTWDRARIPVKSQEAFKVVFKSRSRLNDTVTTAIRNFEVSTAACDFRPLNAEPEFHCPVTKYQCLNKQCVDKKYRCNGVKDGCMDGSDENGCICPTGYFTCSNGECIEYRRLCNGKRDCKDGEDEFQCGISCAGHQCFGGECVTGPCSSKVCDDRSHRFSKCGYCSSRDIEYCGEQRNVQCQTLKGVCGFDNGPCGLAHINSTMKWIFYTPTGKDGYPRYDHSMENEGSFYILKPTINKTGISQLAMKWIKTQAYCLQFWYIIPEKSDSSLEIAIETPSKRASLWNMRSSTSGEWSFGQVEIPRNSTGQLIIVGDTKSGYVALDDMAFIEGGCSTVKQQDSPSCSFDDGKSCDMSIEGAWKSESGKLPNMHKQYQQQGASDGYLALSQSIQSQQTLSNITTPAIHPKKDGWRCLRFWVFSGKDYFSRKLSVFFKTNDNSTLVWSYASVSNKWIFVQLKIRGNEDNLKVIFQGIKDTEALLAIDDVSFTKHQCQNIPDSLGQECRIYKTLETPERRITAKHRAKPLSDDILKDNTWYRITAAAGNQVPENCVKTGCSSLYKGWINGSLPTVDEGQLEREMCFSSNTNGCCKPSKEVRVRNCGGYYVFKFPALTVTEMKFCSSYKHQIEVKTLSIKEEWKNWKNSSGVLRWAELSTEQVQGVLKETGYPSTEKENVTDVGFLLNGSVTFEVQLKGELKELTFCVWMSMKNVSSLSLTVSISDSENNSPKQIKTTLSQTDDSWRHYCLTWKSAYGVYQVYVDGVATSDYGIFLLDMKTLNDPKLSVTFTSSNTTAPMRINNLNVWNTVLSDHQILYMSYTCGREKGNVVEWAEFLKIINTTTTPAGDMTHYSSTSCTGRQGNIYGIRTNTKSTTPRTATMVSPRYKRASESPGRCVKFRYRLLGPGAKSLKLFQLLDGFPRRPIWIDDNNKLGPWREGQVTLSAVTEYKIIIEAETKEGPGLLSIGALYTSEGYCPSVPQTSQKACNEILSSSTGYVISPNYPSYYSNNAICTWLIKAQENNEIHLEFKEFELEMSPWCKNDYVEVYDGSKQLDASRIGRFCGWRYPPIIQSTSNHLLVVLKTNEETVRTGFKAHYRFIKAEKNNSDCVQDCPADCVCHRRDNGIVVTSQKLIAVPDRLPKQSSAILFYGSEIFQLESENFYNLHRLEFIDLSFNKILEMESKSFVNLPSLKALRLNRNFIRIIEDTTWVGLPNLESLDLGDNLISSFGRNLFSDFKNLSLLSLRSNLVNGLDGDAFQNITSLTYLYLQDNKIKSIPSGLFGTQQNLKILKLHSNKIETFNKRTFTGLKTLKTLTLHNNSIKESTIPKDAFDSLANLKHLTLDSFILCCYAKQSIPGLTCDSQGNSFSSCEDMLKNIVIRFGIWLQAIFATVGNISVIIWWSIGSKRSGKQSSKADVQSWFLINLAMADFLMGIYLMIIAIQDTIFQGTYFQHDVDWRSGITCQIAGAISTLSSEVSVMMLVAMTADRFNSIIFDLRAKRLNLRFARILCAIVWVIGFLVSFMPVFLPSYFFDQESGFSFYGRSTVCLPFQLTSEQPAGWEYSVAVFIVFNGAAIFFIFVAYTAIFIKVQQSAKGVRNSRSKSSSLGRRVVFVVMTDFLCWMPVIVIGILSLAGSFKDSTGQVYAWIAVFVLPVNSSINPILYTFSTPQVVKKLKGIGTTKTQSKGSSQGSQGTMNNTQGTTLKPTKRQQTRMVDSSTSSQQYGNPAFESEQAKDSPQLIDNMYENMNDPAFQSDQAKDSPQLIDNMYENIKDPVFQSDQTKDSQQLNDQIYDTRL